MRLKISAVAVTIVLYYDDIHVFWEIPSTFQVKFQFSSPLVLGAGRKIEARAPRLSCLFWLDKKRQHHRMYTLL